MNNNTPHNQHFKEAILEKIRSGEVRMRPKAYFIMKILILAAIIGSIFITSSLLISFIFFSIKMSGRFSLLDFGLRGIFMFFLHFPWKMLVVEIILIIALEWILKHFKFGYRNPFLYLLSGTLIVSIFAGMIINFTPLHKFLLRRTQEKRLPVFGGFYEDIKRPSEKPDIIVGKIVSIEKNTFFIQMENPENNQNRAVYKVLIPPDIHLMEPLKTGDRILIAGDWFDNRIHAYGIKKMPPDIEEN